MELSRLINGIESSGDATLKVDEYDFTSKFFRDISTILSCTLLGELIDRKSIYSANVGAKNFDLECITKLMNKDEHFIETIVSQVKDKYPDDVDKIVANLSTLKSFIKLVIYSLRSEDVDVCLDVYGKSYEEYLKVLETYKALANELKISDSLELSHLLSYLLWNGYFSVSKEHKYSLNDRLLIDGFLPLDTLLGRGCCLNYSQLLRDYLRFFDVKSSFVLCKPHNRVNSSYKPDFKRTVNVRKSDKKKIALTSLFLKKIIDKMGNHAITLVEGKNGLFYYDATNLVGLNITSPNKAEIVNGQGVFDIHPSETLVLFPFSDPDKLLIRLYEQQPEYSGIKRGDFVDTNKSVVELLNKNKNLLDDAYDNIHSSLKIVESQANQIGNKSQVRKYVNNKKKQL